MKRFDVLAFGFMSFTAGFFCYKATQSVMPVIVGSSGVDRQDVAMDLFSCAAWIFLSLVFYRRVTLKQLAAPKPGVSAAPQA